MPMFQLTPARSGRLVEPGDLARRNVSTHARAQRATVFAIREAATASFQLTPARSGRPHRASWCYPNLFQLTPARSGRRSDSLNQRYRDGFNSRPRAAGDVDHDLRLMGTVVSTHARAQRATIHSRLSSVNARWFQLTPARSGRQSGPRRQIRAICFNSRPRAAGDLSLRIRVAMHRVSTHARAQRAT